jgi:hypothetical protein
MGITQENRAAITAKFHRGVLYHLPFAMNDEPSEPEFPFALHETVFNATAFDKAVSL